MRVSVVHIPTNVDGAERNWPGSQGGRRRTSASGGTRCDRAYKGRRGTPGASPSRPPLAVARLRSRLANDVRSLTPPPPLPPCEIKSTPSCIYANVGKKSFRRVPLSSCEAIKHGVRR